MSQPSFPPEIHEKIVKMLGDSPEGLQHVSAASKEFAHYARPLLFQVIRVRSFKSIVGLSSLLSSEHCTIPTTARKLDIRFEHPCPDRKLYYELDDTLFALADAFDYFTDFEDSITLDLPWAFSRSLDWGYLDQYSNIKKFVLTGVYSWILDLTRFLSSMHSLEILVVDANFKCDSAPSTSSIFGSTKVSSKLKEIALSSQSLSLLRWICDLEEGPKELHTLRIKVDGVAQHLYHFYDLRDFLKRYGGEVAHLFVWFEGRHDDLYEVLRDDLYYAPNLSQLELLFPDNSDPDETKGFAETICATYVDPESTVVNSLCGEHIGVDEAEFWATPSPCGGDAHVVCERMSML